MGASFEAFATLETAYRGLGVTPADILNDTIDACRVISFRERNRTEPDKSRFTELQTGIQSFSNYLIAGNFRIDEALTAAAKVAYLCSKLLSGDYTPLIKYDGQEINTLEIKDPQWNALNRLKRLPDQSAFFYWNNALKLRGVV